MSTSVIDPRCPLPAASSKTSRPLIQTPVTLSSAVHGQLAQRRDARFFQIEG